MKNPISQFKIKNRLSLKAGSWYTVGNIFNKAIAFLTVPIFTRLLSTYEYGVVSTYLAWVLIMTLLLGLSLGSSVRTAYVSFKDELPEYMSSVLFLSLINFIIMSSLILAGTYIFKIDINIWLVFFCLIQSYMHFVIGYLVIKYMMEVNYIKRTLLLSLPNLISTIISIILIIFFLKENLYIGRIIPYVIINTIFGIYIYINIIRKGKRLIDVKYWKYAVTISIPLIFHGLSIIILSQSDRIMITLFKGASSTGIYSMAYSISMILIMFNASLDGVWIPWFTNKMNDEKKNLINTRVGIYIDIMLVIAVSILFISPEILVLMAPEEYWSGKYIIPPVLISSFLIFLYSLSVNIEYYYQKTKKIALNTLIAAIINIVLNLIFIPVYGAIAAAFTTLVSYLILFIMHYIVGKKLDLRLFPWKMYIRSFVILILSTIVVYLLMEHRVARIIIMIIFAIVYIYYIYKKHGKIILKFDD